MELVKIFLSYLSKIKVKVENEEIKFSIGEMDIISLLVQGIVIEKNQNYIMLDDGSDIFLIGINDLFPFQVGQYLQMTLELFPKSDDDEAQESSREINNNEFDIVYINVLDLSDKPNRESLWTYEVIHIFYKYYKKLIDPNGTLFLYNNNNNNNNKNNKNNNNNQNNNNNNNQNNNQNKINNENVNSNKLKKDIKVEKQQDIDEKLTIVEDFNENIDYNLIEEESMYIEEEQFDYSVYDIQDISSRIEDDLNYEEKGEDDDDDDQLSSFSSNNKKQRNNEDNETNNTTNHKKENQNKRSSDQHQQQQSQLFSLENSYGEDDDWDE
ncbi:hypothetical protein ACTFIU_002421 [Dictyostelium citrinum]